MELSALQAANLGAASELPVRKRTESAQSASVENIINSKFRHMLMILV